MTFEDKIRDFLINRSLDPGAGVLASVIARETMPKLDWYTGPIPANEPTWPVAVGSMMIAQDDMIVVCFQSGDNRYCDNRRAYQMYRHGKKLANIIGFTLDVNGWMATGP